MNVYVENRDGVSVNGRPLPLCLEIANHSPTGFSWGYGGSGPAQLALAILVHEYGKDLDQHPEHYQVFKWDVLAQRAGPVLYLTSGDIQAWAQERARA